MAQAGDDAVTAVTRTYRVFARQEVADGHGTWLQWLP